MRYLIKKLANEVRLYLWIRRIRRDARMAGLKPSLNVMSWEGSSPFRSVAVTPHAEAARPTLVEPPVNDPELLDLVVSETDEQLFLITVARRVHQSTCAHCRNLHPTA